MRAVNVNKPVLQTQQKVYAKKMKSNKDKFDKMTNKTKKEIAETTANQGKLI